MVLQAAVLAVASSSMVGACVMVKYKQGYAPTPKLADTIDSNNCITDPVAYAKVKFSASADAGFHQAKLGGDIDGDGAEDLVVRVDGAPTTVFATNGSCRRDLGDVQGTILTLVETNTDSSSTTEAAYRDLVTFASAGCAGLAGQVLQWTVRDEVLAGAAIATCGCPDLARPNPSRHPMCPRATPG